MKVDYRLRIKIVLFDIFTRSNHNTSLSIVNHTNKVIRQHSYYLLCLTVSKFKIVLLIDYICVGT